VVLEVSSVARIPLTLAIRDYAHVAPLALGDVSIEGVDLTLRRVFDANQQVLADAGLVAEVEEFVAAAGWDQPPQLFALVTTVTLLASQPELAEQLDARAPLTPVAQDALPEGELDVALAGIEWPHTVAGCALAQEIVVLPPEAEAGLGELPNDPVQARRAAAGHPQRREGRLVAAVLRDGASACVLVEIRKATQQKKIVMPINTKDSFNLQKKKN